MWLSSNLQWVMRQYVTGDTVCCVWSTRWQRCAVFDRQLFAICLSAMQLLAGADAATRQPSDQIAQWLEKQLGLELLRGLA